MPNLDHDFSWPLAGVLGALLFFVAISLWRRRRGMKRLRQWAAAQGWELVSAQRRTFVPHWRAESGQGFQFFRVTVRESGGALRKSWMRCSDFAGHDPARMEVIWDDELAKQTDP